MTSQGKYSRFPKEYPSRGTRRDSDKSETIYDYECTFGEKPQLRAI
jgi:hypothetical protein